MIDAPTWILAVTYLLFGLLSFVVFKQTKAVKFFLIAVLLVSCSWLTAESAMDRAAQQQETNNG